MMKSSANQKCRFIETIRIEDGIGCNLAYHQERMRRTCSAFFPGREFPRLVDLLKDTAERPGITKARIEYGEEGILDRQYTPYTMRTIRSFRLVEDNSISYAYKSADRSGFEKLLRGKGDADEIIIVQNGLLTDTSFSNIALWDGADWYTPAAPLLAGTMRQSLLDRRLVQEANITVDQLEHYSKISLINAMLPLGRCVVTFPWADK